jgi:FKBP-type peptidyl-prolyl cis-trans isomerase FkpA
MNRYLIVFIIVTALGVGAILVYAKNNGGLGMAKDPIQDQIINFASGSAQQQSNTAASPVPTIGPVTELRINDIKAGTGEAVKDGDTVSVHYTGAFLDGRKFDSSVDRGQPFSFTVGAGEVIKGWDQGLIGMKVGGQRELLIPSDLAYGEQGAQGAIPPNTPLYFQIQLIEIKPPQDTP